MPEYDRSVYEYGLELPSGVSEIRLRPESFNKYNKIEIMADGKEYRYNSMIPVSFGTEISLTTSGASSLRSLNSKTYRITITNKAAMDVEKMIRELPGLDELTVDDKADVEAARAAFDALTKAEQEAVSNIDVLEAAEKRIKDIENLTDADKKAVEKVMILINDISDPVTLESEKSIRDAREAYDALKEEQKAFVTNYDRLAKAESDLETIKEGRKAIQNVIKLIDKIGGTITLGSEKSIQSARKAYDKLAEAQQAAVTNYDKLTKAESDLKVLKEHKAAVDNVIGLIDKIGAEITLDSKAAIEAARAAYNNLSNEQKKAVSNYTKLTTAEKKLKELGQNDPQPEPEAVTLMDSETGVSLSGTTLRADMKLKVSRLGTDSAAVKTLRGQVPSTQGIFALYSVALLQNGKEINPGGKAELSLPVGEKYNGKTMTVLLHSNGKVDKLSGTVEKGFIKTEVAKLGDFGVVTDLDKGSTGNSGSTGSDGKSNAAAGTGSGTKSAKTGDAMPEGFGMTVLLLIAGMSTILVCLRRRKE